MISHGAGTGGRPSLCVSTRWAERGRYRSLDGLSPLPAGRTFAEPTDKGGAVTGAALVPDTLLHLAVALDGACRHTCAGAERHPAYWAALARTAERGLLDLVTIGDARPDDGEHPDAALLAAYLAPLTRHLGLVPVLS